MSKSFNLFLDSCLFAALLGCGSNTLSDSALNSVPSHCSNKSVKYISVPLDYSEPEDRKISLAFEEFAGMKKDSVTIIYLPGGPAATLGDHAVIDRLPKEYNRIQLDYRGLGCSNKEDVPAAAINSHNMALDLLTLVKELEIKNYVIYGASFGTVIGTKATSIAEKIDFISPISLVLDGVVGGTYGDDHSVESGFVRNWKVVYDLYPKELQEKMAVRDPFGIPDEKWAGFIHSSLYAGLHLEEKEGEEAGQYEENFPLYHFPMALASDDVDQKTKNMIVKALSNQSDDDEDSLESGKLDGFTTVYMVCSELYETYYDTEFKNGKLIVGDNDTCKFFSFTDPYIPLAWPTEKTPIYYFHGQLDPITTEWHLQNHMELRISPIEATILELGGHGVTARYLYPPKCSEPMWRSIVQGKTIRPVIENKKLCGERLSIKSNFAQ